MSTSTTTMPIQDIPFMPAGDAMSETMAADANKPVVTERAADAIKEIAMACAPTDAPEEGMRATGEALKNSSTTDESPSETETPPSLSNSSNASHASSIKKKLAVTPKNPAAEPKTYPQAILHVVWNAGVLSRVGITTECNKLGFDKATCIKSALRNCLKAGVILVDANWYTIGGDRRNDQGYTARLKQGISRCQSVDPRQG